MNTVFPQIANISEKQLEKSEPSVPRGRMDAQLSDLVAIFFCYKRPFQKSAQKPSALENDWPKTAKNDVWIENGPPNDPKLLRFCENLFPEEFGDKL